MYIDIYVYIYIPNKKPELVNMPSSKQAIVCHHQSKLLLKSFQRNGFISCV